MATATARNGASETTQNPEIEPTSELETFTTQEPEPETATTQEPGPVPEPEIELIYSAKEEYEMHDLSPAAWHGLAARYCIMMCKSYYF